MISTIVSSQNESLKNTGEDVESYMASKDNEIIEEAQRESTINDGAVLLW